MQRPLRRVHLLAARPPAVPSLNSDTQVDGGRLLYMLPLGAGVDKDVANNGAVYGQPEDSFWCA